MVLVRSMRETCRFSSQIGADSRPILNGALHALPCAVRHRNPCPSAGRRTVRRSAAVFLNSAGHVPGLKSALPAATTLLEARLVTELVSARLSFAAIAWTWLKVSALIFIHAARASIA